MVHVPTLLVFGALPDSPWAPPSPSRRPVLPGLLLLGTTGSGRRALVTPLGSHAAVLGGGGGLPRRLSAFPGLCPGPALCPPGTDAEGSRMAPGGSGAGTLTLLWRLTGGWTCEWQSADSETEEPLRGLLQRGSQWVARQRTGPSDGWLTALHRALGGGGRADPGSWHHRVEHR